MNRRGIVISGLAAAGAAVVVIAIVASSGGFGSGSRHVVPDLRGQRLDAAEAKLEAIGLDSDTRGGGTFGVVVRSHWRVCAQEPLPGVTTSSVVLVVDRECEWSAPDVTGLKLKRAERALDSAGTPYFVTYPEDVQRVPKDIRFVVCGQEPAYGPTSEPIQLSVSRTCELPDLAGLRLAAALDKLQAAGLVVAAFTDTGRRVWSGRWRVCEQDPAAGASASRIRLTVYRSCELPDVTGMAAARAIGKLQAAGVAVRALTAGGRRVSRGAWWVCRQDPPAYEFADRVTLTVGPKCRATNPITPSSNALPYLEGYGVDFARASLDAIGVYYRLVVSRTSRGLDLSLLTVCHQVPEAGGGVPDGGAAVLYVADDCYSEWPSGFRK